MRSCLALARGDGIDVEDTRQPDDSTQDIDDHVGGIGADLHAEGSGAS